MIIENWLDYAIVSVMGYLAFRCVEFFFWLRKMRKGGADENPSNS